MAKEFSRTEMLIGAEAMERLHSSAVIVFGAGGVGSYVIEALARGGIGKIAIVDNDRIAVSNINRQLIALHSTVDRLKAEVAAERVRDINPDCNVTAYPIFYSVDDTGGICLADYDFIVDAIDTVSSKLYLIEQADKLSIPIISSMGTGNKLDPTRFRIADINKTSVCPLARVMRYELRQRGIKKLRVLFSDEPPVTPQVKNTEEEYCARRQIPGSISFVPSAAGLIIAGEVIRELSSGI